MSLLETKKYPVTEKARRHRGGQETSGVSTGYKEVVPLHYATLLHFKTSPCKGGKYNDVGALKTVLEIVDTEFARVRGVTEEWNRKFEKYRELVKPA